MSENNEANVKNILMKGSEALKLDWKDLSKHTIETYSIALIADRLNQLEISSKKEINELKARQQKVAFLQKLLKAINAATDGKGNVDFTANPEIKEMLTKAKEIGAMVDDTKLTYSADERERLVDNIRLTNDDLSTQNEMQLQLVTRLTNERLEAYQFARSITKPLHEDKQNKARAIGGR